MSDVSILLNHEIRYRNDQHRVIYGLYREETIDGLVGLARNRPGENVEILHFAIADDGAGAEAGRILLEMVLARESRATVVWRVPESFRSIAADLGFLPNRTANDGQPWQYPTA